MIIHRKVTAQEMCAKATYAGIDIESENFKDMYVKLSFETNITSK